MNCKPVVSEDIIEAARKLCIERQCNDATGHSHYHSFRVHDTTVALQASEGGNPLKVCIAALLHDVNDKKLLKKGVEPIDLVVFLSDCGLEIEIANHIVAIIDNISFKGASVEQIVPDIETAIVMDADRLDAIGAIGIARAFAYGGATGHDLYEPDERPEMHSDEESYFANRHCTVNHFHEKLLLLKDRMNTDTGKQMAQKRHNYMINFLKQFHAEWRGEI